MSSIGVKRYGLSRGAAQNESEKEVFGLYAMGVQWSDAVRSVLRNLPSAAMWRTGDNKGEHEETLALLQSGGRDLSWSKSDDNEERVDRQESWSGERSGRGREAHSHCNTEDKRKLRIISEVKEEEDFSLEYSVLLSATNKLREKKTKIWSWHLAVGKSLVILRGI